ncbi:MAG: HIT domain-containing protein [Bacteroidota bacterium]
MKNFYTEEVLSGKTKVSVVCESEKVLAFHHTRPYFERHIVIIPRFFIESLSDAGATDPTLAAEFLNAIHKVTAMVEAEFGGCRVSSNVGNYQTTKHLHWYVHAGKRLRAEDGSPIAH